MSGEHEQVQQKADCEYTFVEVLQPEEITYWGQVYEETFREANEESPEKQTMSPEEFRAAMLDPDITKLVVSDQEGIAAMTIYGDINKPEIFSWLSQPYFAKHYPGQYENGKVQYFVATLVRPDVQATGVMGSMGQMITDQMIGQHGDVAVIFDCCEQNSWLPKVLKELVDLTLEQAEAEATNLVRIGSQEFYGFKMRARMRRAANEEPSTIGTAA